MKHFALLDRCLNLLLCCVALSSCAPLAALKYDSEIYGGQHVGNGGDPVEQLFESARLDALKILRAFNPKDIALPHAEEDFGDVIAFLTQEWSGEGAPQQRIHEAMIADVSGSRHLYLEDKDEGRPAQPTCARTNLPPPHLSTDIVFSLKLCQGLLNQYDSGLQSARELILHESSHHFGLTDTVDENLAARVGTFLVANANASQLRLQPHVSLLERSGAPAARLQPHLAIGSEPDGTSSMFLYGGCLSVDLPSRDACNRFLGDAYLLNLGTQEWQALAQAPLSERAQASVSFLRSEDGSESGFAVWGGCTGSSAACSTKLGDGAFYDARKGEWAALTPSPLSPRSHAATASLSSLDSKKSALFVWGGLTENGADNKGALLTLGSSEQGHEISSWRSVPMPGAVSLRARFEAGVAATGSRAFVWGGCAKMGIFRCAQPLGDGFLFDLKNETYSLLPDIPFDFEPRTRHSINIVQNKLVIFGGEGKEGFFSDGAVLDLESMEWAPLEAPNGESQGRSGHTGLPLGQELLIAGGVTKGQQAASSLLRLRFSESGLPFWAPLITSSYHRTDGRSASSSGEGYAQLNRRGAHRAIVRRLDSTKGQSVIVVGGIDPEARLIGVSALVRE